MKVLLSTACWPNLCYIYHVINAGAVIIEQYEHYQKQSFRNRYQILSANGILDLSIPVEHRAQKMPMREVQIDYSEKWQIRHWRALTSAYKNSPFFEYLEDEFKIFYDQKHDSLLEYNRLQLELILKILKIAKPVSYTQEYVSDPADLTDLRQTIHPKKTGWHEGPAGIKMLQPYYQTFGDKFGFVPNLSILDLIFNTGLSAAAHLKN